MENEDNKKSKTWKESKKEEAIQASETYVREENQVCAKSAHAHPLMTLQSFCDTLGNTGIHKFAYSRIKSHCTLHQIALDAKTSHEWEKIYLEL